MSTAVSNRGEKHEIVQYSALLSFRKLSLSVGLLLYVFSMETVVKSFKSKGNSWVGEVWCYRCCSGFDVSAYVDLQYMTVLLRCCVFFVYYYIIQRSWWRWWCIKSWYWQAYYFLMHLEVLKYIILGGKNTEIGNN